MTLISTAWQLESSQQIRKKTPASPNLRCPGCTVFISEQENYSHDSTREKMWCKIPAPAKTKAPKSPSSLSLTKEQTSFYCPTNHTLDRVNIPPPSSTLRNRVSIFSSKNLADLLPITPVSRKKLTVSADSNKNTNTIKHPPHPQPPASCILHPLPSCLTPRLRSLGSLASNS